MVHQTITLTSAAGTGASACTNDCSPQGCNPIQAREDSDGPEPLSRDRGVQDTNGHRQNITDVLGFPFNPRKWAADPRPANQEPPLWRAERMSQHTSQSMANVQAIDLQPKAKPVGELALTLGREVIAARGHRHARTTPMRKQNTLILAEFPRGRGRPYLAWQRGRTTSNITWTDGGVRDYIIYGDRLDASTLGAELIDLLKTTEWAAHHRRKLSMYGAQGGLYRIQNSIAEQAFEIVRRHQLAALEGCANQFSGLGGEKTPGE